MVRTVTYREPEFDAAEANLMLAFQALEDDMGPYGIPVSEAMDPDNQWAFEAPAAPRVNWAVKAVDDFRDQFYEANKDASRNGHQWYVKRKPQS